MAGFAPLLEVETLDMRILDAIAETMRERDIVVLDTYRGLDRTTGELPEVDSEAPPRQARIFLEWIRRKGRFGLDLELWGEGVRTDISQAKLAREFVSKLGSAVLFSDCSHFGFSWLKHEVDGSIWEVVSNTDDINDFDLLCDLAPDDPRFCPARLIWPAGRPLPSEISTATPQRLRACEGESLGSTRLCRHFSTPYCPRHGAPASN